MLNVTDFIQKFFDYLGNGRRLPFEVNPYRVELSQAVEDLEESGPSPITFYLKKRTGDVTLAHINVNPFGLEYNDKSSSADAQHFSIESISTDYHTRYGSEPRQGYGRELIRRAVLFAYENGFETVRTTPFSENAASFWYGLGFNPYKAMPAIDDRVAGASEWKEKIQASPQVVWGLAQTEIGRRLLAHDANSGILDLTNDAQRTHAFARLHLPLQNATHS